MRGKRERVSESERENESESERMKERERQRERDLLSGHFLGVQINDTLQSPLTRPPEFA